MKENKKMATKYEYYMGTPHGLCARVSSVTEVRICLEIDLRTDRHAPPLFFLCDVERVCVYCTSLKENWKLVKKYERQM